MNLYEALIIFKPILDVENVDAVLNHFQKNIVEAHQGEVVSCDRIGRKRLAYEISKFKDGFLTQYVLKFPPDQVAPFRRLCQINEDILRLTMIRQTAEILKARAMEPPRFQREGSRDGRGGRFFGDRDRDRDRGDRRPMASAAERRPAPPQEAVAPTE